MDREERNRHIDLENRLAMTEARLNMLIQERDELNVEIFSMEDEITDLVEELEEVSGCGRTEEE